MALRTNGRRITREDLEKAFSKTIGEGETVARAKAPQAVVIGAAVALGLLTLAYLAGRRSGRHRSAIVEVRRL